MLYCVTFFKTMYILIISNFVYYILLVEWTFLDEISGSFLGQEGEHDKSTHIFLNLRRRSKVF